MRSSVIGLRVQLLFEVWRFKDSQAFTARCSARFLQLQESDRLAREARRQGMRVLRTALNPSVSWCPCHAHPRIASVRFDSLRISAGIWRSDAGIERAPNV